MPDTGEKVPVSTEDLNEVWTSLESSMDTKMNKMESKIDQLTELINSIVMDKTKQPKALNEDEDPLLAGAQKAAIDEEEDPKKTKGWSSLQT